MLTIKQLLQLNRELRKSLMSGWSTHISGPNEGKYWPLIHYTIQVMRKHEALELLAERGLGQEAGIILRSMFEATVNAMWISKDLEARIKRYHSYQFFSAQQYRNLADRHGIKSEETPRTRNKNREKTLKEKAEEAGWREMEKYNFKKGAYWSGMTLRKMAEDIGWLDRYEIGYKIYSDVTHSGVASGNDYISQSDSGVTFVNVVPQWEHSKACLQEAYCYLTFTFEVLNDCIGMELDKQLDVAWAKMPEILPGSPNIMKDIND